MMHKDLFERFKAQFPNEAQNVETWFPNGRNSICIRFSNKEEWIFTFHDVKTWCIETTDHFLRKENRK